MTATSPSLSPSPPTDMPPEADREAILRTGREILTEEGQAILQKRDTLGDAFVRLVERLLALEGKVGVTGVGKSGLIGEKIAATLSSTGTPALFLKSVDGVHGDLGVLRAQDYLIAISNSGETTEVLALVQAARAIGVSVAALTGQPDSTLAREAEIALDIGVSREACPLGLAPTASTTVTLALGDALAMALSRVRGFTPENYASFHPGGALGQRLKFRVQDVLRWVGDDLPCLPTRGTLLEALGQMSARDNSGVTLVVDAEGQLAGILTDGDVRRILLAEAESGREAPLSRPVESYMARNPKVIAPEAPVSEALQVMEVHGITSLAVVDPHSRPVGLLHLHDILGRGKILL